MHQQLLYPKEEARLAVGYKRRAWDYVIASGELPVIRHGNRVFVTAEALLEFAKRDRPRMIPMGEHPHAARDVAKGAESLPALSSEGSEQRSTTSPTDRAQAERNRMLRRRRRALGDECQ
jgi:hypothetical protein